MKPVPVPVPAVLMLRAGQVVPCTDGPKVGAQEDRICVLTLESAHRTLYFEGLQLSNQDHAASDCMDTGAVNLGYTFHHVFSI